MLEVLEGKVARPLRHNLLDLPRLWRDHVWTQMREHLKLIQLVAWQFADVRVVSVQAWHCVFDVDHLIGRDVITLRVLDGLGFADDRVDL